MTDPEQQKKLMEYRLRLLHLGAQMLLWKSLGREALKVRMDGWQEQPWQSVSGHRHSESFQ